MTYIEEYLSEIEAGHILVNRRVRTIYERLREHIRNPGRWIFDEERAHKPIRFIETFLKHSRGQFHGKPFILELWQKCLIEAAWGFYDKDTDERMIQEIFCTVARKNGKTQLAAALCLFAVLDEMGADVFCIANTYSQSCLLFDEARAMVRQCPELAALAKKTRKGLEFPSTFSCFSPLASNSSALDGKSASFAVLDEVWAYQDPELYYSLKQSQSARKNPCLLSVSTAGTVREGVWDMLHAYSVNICDGIIEDDRFLPLLYELDKTESEWLDPKCWVKANPNLNVSKSYQSMVEKIKRCETNPSDLNPIKNKDLNVITAAHGAWLDYSIVENPEKFNIEDFRGCYFVGGCDLSICTDLTCATATILGKDDKKYVLQMYFLPSENFHKRVEEEHIPYDIWERQKLLRLCPGHAIDPEMVKDWFLELVNVYGLVPVSIGYDPYGSVYFEKSMVEEGFEMVKVRQGAQTLSSPMYDLAANLAAKKVIYNDNPLLKWCILNTSVVIDRNGNQVPIKNQQPKFRIDGLASLLDSWVVLLDRYDELKLLAERR